MVLLTSIPPLQPTPRAIGWNPQTVARVIQSVAEDTERVVNWSQIMTASKRHFFVYK